MPSHPAHNTISDQPGAKVAAWLNSLFTVIVALGTFGTSVTFSYVVSGIRAPVVHARFSTVEFEVFISLSWLLFLLALAFATLFSTLLAFYNEQAIADWQNPDRAKRLLIQWTATITTAILYGLVIAAFIFLSLVITAYSPTVGWVACGFTTAFGFGGFIAITIQCPLFRRKR